jgi:hypothetical protein
MAAKRGTKKAQPEAAGPEEAGSANPVPAPATAGVSADGGGVSAEGGAGVSGEGGAADDTPPAPANRAERRAMAKGRAAAPPVGKVKQFGRGAPATQTPRHWQGRRGG